MALEHKRLLTYDDYAALPDDGKRYELINGELYVTPSPTFWHQNLALQISVAFGIYLKSHPIGVVCIAPLDVVLGQRKHQTYQPDVMFISNERRHVITDENIQGAPDLVVEVLSPKTQKRDVGPKKRNYARYGVTEYWIVWQDVPRVEVYRRNKAGRYGDPHLLEAGGTLTTDLLPGFSLAIDTLYADLPSGPTE